MMSPVTSFDGSAYSSLPARFLGCDRGGDVSWTFLEVRFKPRSPPGTCCQGAKNSAPGRPATGSDWGDLPMLAPTFSFALLRMGPPVRDSKSAKSAASCRSAAHSAPRRGLAGRPTSCEACVCCPRGTAGWMRSLT